VIPYLLLLTFGCADECTIAFRRKQAAVENCGSELPEDFDHECSDDYLELLECEADCLEEASCDSIVGSRSGDISISGWSELHSCTLRCPSPW
jgi:hypothetical protein